MSEHLTCLGLRLEPPRLEPSLSCDAILSALAIGPPTTNANPAKLSMMGSPWGQLAHGRCAKAYTSESQENPKLDWPRRSILPIPSMRILAEALETWNRRATADTKLRSSGASS